MSGRKSKNAPLPVEELAVQAGAGAVDAASISTVGSAKVLAAPARTKGSAERNERIVMNEDRVVVVKGASWRYQVGAKQYVFCGRGRRSAVSR
jgi:hypothetical protein